MKKICFLVDSIFSFGGVQRVTAVIAKELAQRHNITIVTFDEKSSLDTSFYGLAESDICYRFFHYPQVGAFKNLLCKAYSLMYRRLLPQTRFTSNLYAHSSFPAERRLALAEELKAGQYDVIIGVHAPLAVRLSSCRKLLGRAKLIGWVHNSHEALFGKGSLYFGPELRKHYEWQLQALDATIVLCQYDATKYHFATRVIYNPLTLKPGRHSTGKSRKFLAIGRFSHRHKGFDLLIDAFSLFAKHDGEWTLDIVGEGPEELLYRKMIASHGLENRIRLHPFTSNIQAYYSEAQVYVLSSRWEGFGLVLVEAMAHGLPIVSSNLPVCREIMGEDALYFSVGDVEDLARRLEDVTHIDWKVKSAKSLGIARSFATENIIGQWSEIIG